MIGAVIDRQARIIAADPLNLSLQHTPRRPIGRKNREANARRAAIDGQDTGHRLTTFHPLSFLVGGVRVGQIPTSRMAPGAFDGHTIDHRTQTIV
jgi:hypothetical protein